MGFWERGEKDDVSKITKKARIDLLACLQRFYLCDTWSYAVGWYPNDR